MKFRIRVTRRRPRRQRMRGCPGDQCVSRRATEMCRRRCLPVPSAHCAPRVAGLTARVCSAASCVWQQLLKEARAHEVPRHRHEITQLRIRPPLRLTITAPLPDPHACDITANDLCSEQRTRRAYGLVALGLLSVLGLRCAAECCKIAHCRREQARPLANWPSPVSRQTLLRKVAQSHHLSPGQDGAAWAGPIAQVGRARWRLAPVAVGKCHPQRHVCANFTSRRRDVDLGASWPDRAALACPALCRPKRDNRGSAVSAHSATAGSCPGCMLARLASVAAFFSAFGAMQASRARPAVGSSCYSASGSAAIGRADNMMVFQSRRSGPDRPRARPPP
jgi:hypothetical protein